MNLYLSYRDGDAPGFPGSLGREIKRQAPDATVVLGRVEPGARVAAIADGATLLLIAGARWLRAADAPIPINDAGDPLRTLLEQAIRRRLKIVPIVFQITLREWESMCGELPSSLRSMSRFNAFEIRQESFQADVERLLGWLRAPDREVPWTEAPARTLIRVEAEGGGLVKWWAGRDKTVRVVVDGSEVGALIAFNGRIDVPVESGRHTVQIRQGPFFKSEAVDVEVARGGTASLVCGRNSFTGTVSLAHKR